MTLCSSHRYVAEASTAGGRRLGSLVLEPDWGPAAEWSHLQGMRRDALPALAHHGPCHVEPVYDEDLGQPYVAGIRVRFDGSDSGFALPLISTSYFQSIVERSARRLVEDGALRAGESFVYRICAYPVQPGDPVPDDLADASAASLSLAPEALAPRVAAAVRMCEPAWHARDYPVFVRSTVLEEAAELARAAGERESGGILVGHLRRDPATREIHAEITAQIPAVHAHAGHAHLRFTPETWSAVHDALALRNRGEIWLGWHHSHPFFCRRCDPARRNRCALFRPFFSRVDCELHRTVFDAGFSVALLISDMGDGSLSYDWFGWREGRVAARGCYMLPCGNTSHPIAPSLDDGAFAARVLNVNEEKQ